MKSKVLFQSDGNVYLQDVTNNLLLFLPDELSNQVEKRFDNPNSTIDDNSTYYARKAEFLIEKLADRRTVAQNFSGRLSSGIIENTLANTRQISFELTERCNLNCEYCAYGELYGHFTPRQNKDLPWEFVRNLFDYLSKYWDSPNYASINKAIAIGFYGGEPLLKMDLIQQIIHFLKEIRTDNIRFIYTMTTNGVLLDKYMNFLAENDVNLLISLDGDERNNSYRATKTGKNSFRKIISNIELLKKRFPIYFKEKVSFNSVLHNRNSVSEINQFFHKQFDKKSSISELNPGGVKIEKKELYNALYQNTVDSLNQAEDYEMLKEDMFIKDPDTSSLMRYINTYSGNLVKNYKYFFVDKENERWLPTGTCVPFGKRIFLTADGKILPCERVGHQYILGHVDNTGVNIDFEAIAKMYNRYYDSLQPQCANCFRLKHCLQCIFYIDKIAYNPVCKGYFDENRFKKYLSDSVAFLSNHAKLYKKIMTEVVLEE